MHPSTYEYLKPTDHQIELMHVLSEAAKAYGEALQDLLPEGADKTYCIRQHRQTAMWANVAATRLTDGSPREDKTVPPEPEETMHALPPFDDIEEGV